MPVSEYYSGGEVREIMKMKGNTYFLLFLLLMGIGAIYFSFHYSGNTPVFTFKLRLLPVVVGSILTILVAADLFGELRKKPTKEESPAKETSAPPTNVKVELETTAWVIAYMLLLYLTGVLLSVFLFTAAYVKVHNLGWLKSIIISLGMAAFVYLMFDVALGISLYKGRFYIPLYGLLP